MYTFNAYLQTYMHQAIPYTAPHALAVIMLCYYNLIANYNNIHAIFNMNIQALCVIHQSLHATSYLHIPHPRLKQNINHTITKTYLFRFVCKMKQQQV